MAKIRQSDLSLLVFFSYHPAAEAGALVRGQEGAPATHQQFRRHARGKHRPQRALIRKATYVLI